MVRRFFFAISLCVALMIGVVGVARAQGSGSQLNADAKEKGYKLYQEEIDAYHLATEDCSSPSLECLVKNTTRFVAIEWVMDIIGPTNTMSSGTAPATPIVPGASGVQSNSINSTSPIAARTGGAIGGLYNMIGGMYAYQPANTSRYVADVMDNAGMVPPAYAQGLGFASLDPILSLWKSFRNLAYFFFIAILIVIGIMIMLRQKISAQASVSAQQALPNIIISLILVTFSYAIAGLLIDAMYLSMFLIAGLFNTIAGGSELGTQMISMNIFQLGGLMFVGGANTWNENGNAITQILTSALGGTDTNPLVAFIGYGAGLTVSIIIAVAVLIGTVKLFVELLKSYASIIMAVVFSPIFLMLGAIPGKNAFSPWLKNLVGNLAAFPVTLLFILIFKIFTENLNTSGAGGFMPPFLIGNGQSGIAGYVLGLAILLALPEIVKTVKKNMGAAEGGFGWTVASQAFAATKEGVKGKYGIPGARWPIGAAALGFSLNRIGPETAMENFLIGSRSARKREEEIQRLNPNAEEKFYGAKGWYDRRWQIPTEKRKQAKAKAAQNAAATSTSTAVAPSGGTPPAVGSALTPAQQSNMVNP